MTSTDLHETPSAISARLQAISSHYAPTPMVEMRALAAGLGVTRIDVKDEGKRTLGSFKSLGGTYAGLRALACLSIMQVLHEGLADSKYRPCPLLVKYVEAGWLGRKAQRGFYDYRYVPARPTR